ncbi:MAG: hypothetical protein ACTHJ4_06625 [Candidatus Nucleicultricaceae bacterium]
MKWIYVLPCLFGFSIIADLKASVADEPIPDEGKTIKKIGKSYMSRNVLKIADSSMLIKTLEHAIEQRIQKLKQLEKEPLNPVKLVRYDELHERREHLKTEGKDLLNEQLSELEHLEAKRAESGKVRSNLDLFEVLQCLDKRFESLKKTENQSIDQSAAPNVEQSVDSDDEQFLSEFEAKRKGYLLRFSPKGRPLFHLLTSLGIAKGYLAEDAWKDETQVLHTATELIKKTTTHTLNVIPMHIDAMELHAHLMAMMEGMLESHPKLLGAITRHIGALDRETLIVIGLSKRPDLEPAYILEEGTEQWSTRHLLFALGVLPQMVQPLGGYVGSSADLEKEIRSRREALLVMKMIEVEDIQQRLIQMPFIPLPGLMNGQFEENDHSDSSDEVEINSTGDDNSSSANEDNHSGSSEEEGLNSVGDNNSSSISEENQEHNSDLDEEILPREGDQGSAIHSDDEESEDVPPLQHMQNNGAGYNQQQEIDPDAFIEALSSGFHLRAFLKVKAQEIHAHALEMYLESARSAKMSKLCSSKSWRNKFWNKAIHKGLLNIAQINPLIQAFEDQTILSGD